MVTLQVSTLPVMLQPPAPLWQVSLSVVLGVTLTVSGELKLGVPVVPGRAVKVTRKASGLLPSLTGFRGEIVMLASTTAACSVTSPHEPLTPTPPPGDVYDATHWQTPTPGGAPEVVVYVAAA